MSQIVSDGLVVEWVVPSLAYTPETYVVEYGMTSDSLVPSEEPVSSGDDIAATDKTYSVELKGLSPGTKYHYVVVARNSARTTRTLSSFIYTKETGKNYYIHQHMDKVYSTLLQSQGECHLWLPPE